LDKELEGHTAANGVEGASEENTEDLKAKLARLKAEAASLGLPEATSAYSSTYRPYRGRGRATRSYYRGATTRPPRASMKLDNRPKRLLIKGVSSDGVQAVRDWYESTGHVDSVTTVDRGDVLVSFKNRSAAEQGLAKGQNIPQVGQVQVSWYTGQPPVTTTKDNSLSPAVAPSEDNKGAEETMHPSNKQERHPSPHHQEEEVVASGWGGDEDEDGMGML